MAFAFRFGGCNPRYAVTVTVCLAVHHGEFFSPVWGINLGAPIFRLLRWDKPTGRLILMVPALWSVFLAAEGQPPWALVGVIILGAIATSAAGCVVNDLWDRNIDPHVKRTRKRPPGIARIIRSSRPWGVAGVPALCLRSVSLPEPAQLYSLCFSGAGDFALSSG